jgi:hypothetical protein
MSQYEQTVTIKLKTEGADPEDILADLMAASDNVVEWDLSAGLAREVTTVNRERLIALAQWAAAEDAKRRLGLPSEWNQSTWLSRSRATACGTACCIAGKVAFDDGVLPEGWDEAEDGEEACYVVLGDGEEVSVDSYAAGALGLNSSQAGNLFFANNTLDDVLQIIGELIAEGAPA